VGRRFDPDRAHAVLRFIVIKSLREVFFPKYGIHDVATVLRGLAALGVFLTHANWGGVPLFVKRLSSKLDSQIINSIFESITLLAQLGPIAFFIGSGYVLTHSIRNKKKKFSNYLISRFTRLSPLYLLTIFMTYRLNSENESLVIILAHITFLDHFFPTIYAELTNDVMWTISVEFWLSISLFFVLRFVKSIKDLFVLLLLLQLVQTIVYFILISQIADNGSYASRFFTNYLTSMMIGSIIYICSQEISKKELRLIFSAIALFTTICFFDYVLFQKTPAGLIVTLFSTLFLLLPHVLNKQIIFPNLLIFLGTICYGIYLFHTIIIYILYRNIQILNSMQLIVALGVTIFAASLSWAIFERPLIKLVNTKRN
jgi:peptidoglycan/LPS O-acetylase OafA/YrhL